MEEMYKEDFCLAWLDTGTVYWNTFFSALREKLKNVTKTLTDFFEISHAYVINSALQHISISTLSSLIFIVFLP